MTISRTIAYICDDSIDQNEVTYIETKNKLIEKLVKIQFFNFTVYKI
jgi:hypothetical protein